MKPGRAAKRVKRPGSWREDRTAGRPRELDDLLPDMRAACARAGIRELQAPSKRHGD
ncbi:MAG: hypothetical protein IT452_22665 [Planctomycetia bacterium]|nr:hypothetical protein [Planctomycetia bacterium]